MAAARAPAVRNRVVLTGRAGLRGAGVAARRSGRREREQALALVRDGVQLPPGNALEQLDGQHHATPWLVPGPYLDGLRNAAEQPFMPLGP